MRSGLGPAAPGGPPFQFSAPVRWLPRPLREASHPIIATLVGWLTAFLPSILLGAFVVQLFGQGGQPNVQIDSMTLILAYVVFAPVVETLIMAGVLTVLLRFLTPTHAILASALGWGLAHSAVAVAWGLVIWWPFLIFSTLFVVWRERSLALALAVPAATHMLQNLLPSLLIRFSAG